MDNMVVRRLFGGPRQRRGDRRESRVLYVHVGADAGLFVVRGWDGSQQWVTEEELLQDLGHARAIQGEVLYSQGIKGSDVPSYMSRAFEIIRSFGLDITMSPEPHRDAVKGFDGGATALIAAALVGEERLVRDLVARRADLEARDDFGYTALMCAANRGDRSMVELLLASGANANARDKSDSTPIMFAAQHGHADAIRALLGAGADVNCRGRHGLTALGFAVQNKRVESADILQASGAHT